MGNNYNFTERWKNDSKYKRIKPFHSELTTKNYLFMKLKQFERRELESKESSSEEEHKVNALAQGADEGRDKLR